MRRRELFGWSAVGGSVVLGGLLLGKPFGGQTVLGSFPLHDLTQPLPDHWVTPTADFYIQSYSGSPQVDLEGWSLRIDGLVERPLTLTYDQIRSEPAETFYWTMECIGNPSGGELIGNALWQGTRLGPFLEEARILPEARGFAIHAADDYRTGLPLSDVLHPDTRLVYAMNGEPLSKQHGFPMRILIPGKYGQKQPKWLTRIEVVKDPPKGHWERQGWSNRADILTQALPRQIQSGPNRQRVSSKSFRLTQPAGRILLAGVALASAKPLQAIEVSADGGKTWSLAERNHPATPYEWTLWRYAWDLPEPGKYELMARAQTKEVQPLQDLWSFDGSNAVLRIRLQLT